MGEVVYSIMNHPNMRGFSTYPLRRVPLERQKE